MTHTVELGIDDVMPRRDAVFAHQGIPSGVKVSTRISRLHRRAREEFAACARPRGIIGELERTKLTSIFVESDNAPDAVVALVSPRADRMALYAATVGATVSARIEELFAANDFALGAMLDSIASQAADRAGEAMAAWFHDRMRAAERLDAGDVVLGYSPGYCGWHIGGQRELFAHLRPQRIGISLNASCMMSPLKSVSGLLIAAQPGAHVFEPRFSYCRDCRDRSCIDRVRPLRAAAGGA